MARDYKKEYAAYHGKPDQIKQRAERVKAQRMVVAVPPSVGKAVRFFFQQRLASQSNAAVWLVSSPQLRIQLKTLGVNHGTRLQKRVRGVSRQARSN
jgi:hypothetical protein